MYKELARLLKDHFDVYGLQDAMNYSESRCYSSLEEMASYFLHVIRTIKHDGKFYLAGASFGATLAVEIANQLQQANYEVKFLGLFDGWPYYTTKLLDKEYFNKMINKTYHSISKEDAEQYIASQYEKEKMLFNYEIPTISTPITLFKAREVVSPFNEHDDLYNNWKKFTNKPMRVYTVNGDHESILEKENVNVIASTICSITMEELEYA